MMTKPGPRNLDFLISDIYLIDFTYQQIKMLGATQHLKKPSIGYFLTTNDRIWNHYSPALARIKAHAIRDKVPTFMYLSTLGQDKITRNQS